jgi:hypothetical protein
MTHGTRTAYNAGCRCSDCRAAQAEYQRLVRAGVTAMLDPAPARQHAEQLLSSGWTWRTLADHAGIDRSALYRQIYGHRTRMQRRVAAAILAIPARRRDVRSERAAARIEDTEFLLTVGEDPRSISARLGVSVAALAQFFGRHGHPDLAAEFERARRAEKRGEGW